MSHSTTGKHFWTSIATWLIFSLAFAIKPTFAQVFPVQANINVTPPYTVYLSHYTAPDQQRVMASVLLHDPVVTSLDVRFRFTIEGAGIRIYTNPGWIPAPFTLRSGITELIPADIIAEYFRPQNVIAEGINPQELFRKGKLPEGFYQFKIEVLEYQRGVPISNVGRTGVWLLLSEPPRVVFPTPNQKVNATNPQILNFTWVPGGVTSPLSALSTMYEFTLVELMGEVDPTVAITTASDAIKFTRTQQQTTLLYGPGDPQLIPGKRYAYRVRAYNTDGYELFKNNGYSEVRVFQFGDACNAPTMFSLKDETQSTFSIDVVADPSSDAWQAQFRESGDESGQWSELKAEPGTSTKTVKGLKASTIYQVQLKSLCGTVSSSYTTPQTITTKEKVNTQRSCENSVSPFVVSQAQPLQQLKPNDIFLAALMPIKVTEVTSQGGGKFSGKGIASVPLFSAGLAVHFTDIGINELMQLTAGEVIVERNAVNVTLLGDTDPTGNGSTTGNGTATDTTGNDGWPEFTDTINISSDIDSVVVVNDTTVWVYTSGGGEPVIVDMGGSDCLLIVPADGNMDNAQVVYNGAAKPYSAGSGSTSGTDEQYTGFRARFTPALNTQYGFDSLRVQAYANYYNDLEIDGKTYKLPWKALPVNIPDPVTLHVRRSASSYPYSDLKVGVLGGNDLLPAAGANTATQTYNLTGTNDGDQYAVVAKYTQEGKSKYVGGIWAATYQPKVHKLYIVPLPGVEVPAATIGQLQNGLTQIYSQAVVSWTVQPLNGFTGVELGDNGLDWADKDMLSSYNAEMNSVISEFKNWKSDADPDAYYLFVVPKFSEGGVEGFMPRNRRFGFVTLSQLDVRLVAHEIGHGAFNLRHTFPEVPQGSTDNLMDYAEGNSLLKPQWDLIHNSETTTGLFDDMEDGASQSSDEIYIKSIINDILCAKKNNQSFIDVSNYKKLERTNPLDNGKFWLSDLPGYNYCGDFQVYLSYANSNSKSTLSIDIINRTDNKVIIGDDINCKLHIEVRRNLNTSATDAEELVNYLKIGKDEANNYIEKILSKMDVMSDISIQIQKIPDCWFSEISTRRRIEYIKKLSSNTNGNINFIIKLVNTVKKDTITNFFEKLGETSLFATFRNRSNMSYNNYTAFIKAATLLYYQQDDIKMKLKDLPYNRLFVHQTREGSLGASFSNSFASTNDSIKITGNVVVVTSTTNPYGVTTPSGTKSFKAYSYTVGYCDLIGLELKSNFGHLNSSILDDIIPLPAFYFDWLNTNCQNEANSKMIDASITIASLAIGVPELRLVIKGGKYVYAAYLGVGVAFTTYNLVKLNSDIDKYFDQVSKTNARVKDIFEFLNNIAVLYDVSNIVVSRVVTKDNKQFFNDFVAAWTIQKEGFFDHIKKHPDGGEQNASALTKELQDFVDEVILELNKK